MSHCTLLLSSLKYKEKESYTSQLKLINKLIYTFKNSFMKVLEKIIALTTVATIIILTVCLASSCSTMETTYKPNYKYLKDHKNQYVWQCPFTN
jgi:hypothetical protein